MEQWKNCTPPPQLPVGQVQANLPPLTLHCTLETGGNPLIPLRSVVGKSKAGASHLCAPALHRLAVQ